MDFDIPEDIQQLLKDLDEFIEAEIKPLEQQDDNIRFFDHRREYARTDFENGGVPRKDWEDLLREMRRRADKAGFLRYGIPAKYGGRDGTNLAMAIVREHLAAKGLGLHNDLQNESSIVGNFPTIKMWESYGSEEQKTRVPRRHVHRQDARRLRADRAQPRLRRDVARDEGRARRRRVGDQRHRSASTAACTPPRTT